MRGRLLVEPRVAVARVRLDDAVLHPAGEGGLVDSETAGELLPREQAAGAQSFEAWPETVRVRDVLHARSREAGAASAGPRGTAGTEPARIEDASDLGVDVLVEQPIDELHDLGRRLHFLPRGLWVHGRERRR